MQEQTYAGRQLTAGPFGYFSFLAGHVKLLVLVPLLAGAAALLVAVSLPKTYSSIALLMIPTDPTTNPHQVAAIMRAEPILRGMDPSTDPEVSARRVSARVGRDGMVRVEVTGKTPEQAQQSARALLDAWFRSTAPGEIEKADLIARRERAVADYKNIQAGIDSATKALGSRDSVATEVLLRLAALSETADRLFTVIQATTRRLDGVPRDVLRQSPSLPTKPRQPPAVAIAVAAAGVALFALLLVLLLRHRYLSVRASWDEGAREDGTPEATRGPAR